MSLKGYLPPEGTQNIHRVPYNHLEGNGTHRVGQATVFSPPEVILTADEDAQREIERHGLEEVPQDVAEAALEAYQADEPEQSVAAIIEEHQASSTEASEEAAEEEQTEDDGEATDESEAQEQAEEAQDEAPAEDAEEENPGVDIPDGDLQEQYEAGDLPYRGEEQPNLTALAQAHGVAANQAAETIIEELEAIRDGGEQ